MFRFLIRKWADIIVPTSASTQSGNLAQSGNPDFRQSGFQDIRIQCPGFQISGSSESRISGFSESRKSGFTEIRISGFPDIQIFGFLEIWILIY
jgi:hypothetical protein